MTSQMVNAAGQARQRATLHTNKELMSFHEVRYSVISQNGVAQIHQRKAVGEISAELDGTERNTQH